jgi:hypothetical protein
MHSAPEHDVALRQGGRLRGARLHAVGGLVEGVDERVVALKARGGVFRHHLVEESGHGGRGVWHELSDGYGLLLQVGGDEIGPPGQHHLHRYEAAEGLIATGEDLPHHARAEHADPRRTTTGRSACRSSAAARSMAPRPGSRSGADRGGCTATSPAPASMRSTCRCTQSERARSSRERPQLLAPYHPRTTALSWRASTEHSTNTDPGRDAPEEHEGRLRELGVLDGRDGVCAPRLG